ncbi:MAG: glycosyltransferase family 2 protein [Lachnospiraceae bacterium]|jgi:rhamnosyltransferase|nr:glycosyltransferase family 2 protein [Lachnospiraceae bacterium]
MKIDVIIPTYGPKKKALELLLERLEFQTFPIHKIIIMNTEAEGFPKDLEQKYPNLEIFHIKKADFDHGGTRNLGAEKSHADYMMFMTQDALPADASLVKRLADSFQDRRVKAAYARQLPRKGCGELECYTRKFNYPEESRIKTKEDLGLLGIKTFFCSNVCAMYERETYEELGGFIRHTIFNEDMIYAGGLIQKGYAVAYVAEARVYHSHHYNGIQQFRRNFDLAVSQADHPEVFSQTASESEGIRLVKRTAAHCMKIKKPWLIFSLVFSSGCKYIGYRLGKNYKKLPRRVILACTGDRSYWEQTK